MDHALTLHSDGTLTITLPKDAEVSRVVVNGAEFRRVSEEPEQPSNGSITRMNPENMHVRTMGDCISRQAAIEALKTDCSWDIFDEYGNVTERGQDIIEAISRVPATEPERFNPCTVCQEFDCTGCKFGRT